MSTEHVLKLKVKLQCARNPKVLLGFVQITLIIKKRTYTLERKTKLDCHSVPLE